MLMAFGLLTPGVTIIVSVGPVWLVVGFSR